MEGAHVKHKQFLPVLKSTFVIKSHRGMYDFHLSQDAATEDIGAFRCCALLVSADVILSYC